MQKKKLILPFFLLPLVACEGTSGSSITEDPVKPIGSKGTPVPNVKSFSVLVASDPQFYWSRDDMVGELAERAHCDQECMKRLSRESNFDQKQSMLELINNGAEGYDKPELIIMNGDLTEYARSDSWDEFDAYYPIRATSARPYRAVCSTPRRSTISRARRSAR